MKILVADDDPLCCDYLVSLLGQEGYSCISVPDARAAAVRLRRDDFDLLISDIKMPGNRSLELLRALQEAASKMPVILLTGHPSLRTAVPAVTLEVTAYLVKPVSSEVLLQWVRHALHRPLSGASSTSEHACPVAGRAKRPNRPAPGSD